MTNQSPSPAPVAQSVEEIIGSLDKYYFGGATPFIKAEDVAAWLRTHPTPVAEKEMREALERLGSMEAFTLSGVVDPIRDAELIARIEYARAALAGSAGEPHNRLECDACETERWNHKTIPRFDVGPKPKSMEHKEHGHYVRYEDHVRAVAAVAGSAGGGATDTLREFVEQEAGLDCENASPLRLLPPCGVCASCRARACLVAVEAGKKAT